MDQTSRDRANGRISQTVAPSILGNPLEWRGCRQIDGNKRSAHYYKRVTDDM